MQITNVNLNSIDKKYNCKQYLCWKFDSLEKLFEKIVKENKKRKAYAYVNFSSQKTIGIFDDKWQLN